jgi:hypothetical protein
MLLIGILLAGGRGAQVLCRLAVQRGHEPNFIIAMYCLIILLVRPRLYEAAIIGILAARCASSSRPALPELVSELVGAVVMSLLIGFR